MQILNGDCRDVLKTFPDESVQCCVTSPPYWGLRDYGHKAQIGQEKSPDEFVASLVAVFDEVRRVLRSDGTLWLNLGDSYAAQRGGTPMPAETIAGGVGGIGADETHRGRTPVAKVAHRNASAFGLKHKDLCGIPWRVAFALQAAGWYLRQDIIWNKPSCMPESVTDRCTKSHEYIFLMSKSAKYFYDHEAIKEEASPDESQRNRDESKLNNTPGRTKSGGLVHNTYTTRNKRSVWSVTNCGYPDTHFATYPPDLIKPCILAGCPTGGVVLDPFGGSGTTGQVALELGRKAILIELNPDYIPLIERRTHVTPGLPL